MSDILIVPQVSDVARRPLIMLTTPSTKISDSFVDESINNFSNHTETPFYSLSNEYFEKKMIYVFKNVHVVDVSFYLIEPIARFLNFKQRLMQNDN